MEILIALQISIAYKKPCLITNDAINMIMVVIMIAMKVIIIAIEINKSLHLLMS